LSYAIANHRNDGEVNGKAATLTKRSSHGRGIDLVTAPSATPHHSIFQLQRTIGNQAVQGLMRSNASNNGTKTGIQTNLKISQPDDANEKEADRISEQVMRMSSTNKITGTVLTNKKERIARKCSACEMKEEEEEEEEKLNINRKQSTMSCVESSVDATTEINNVLSNSGTSLDNDTKDFMESRFGYDFSKVHIHKDERAAKSAQSVNALAYTVGQDIVFAPSQYAPKTREGQKLLAHELTHVLQHETNSNGAGYRLFRDTGKDKPPPSPPPPNKAQPPTPATPCVPNFKSLKAVITGSVGVREVSGDCALILGTPGKANGATVTSKVDVPAGCTGTLQYVQLVDTCISFHLTSGKNMRLKTGGFWIDTRDPVDQKQVSEKGSVIFETNDSPHIPIRGPVKSAHRHDSFKIWLMWKPDQPADAARVPLAMASWSWSAEAALNKADEEDCGKRWKVTKSSKAGGNGKATSDLPTATKTVGPGNPPIEEGQKC
jgi:hypothetical protein